MKVIRQGLLLGFVLGVGATLYMSWRNAQARLGSPVREDLTRWENEGGMVPDIEEELQHREPHR